MLLGEPEGPGFLRASFAHRPEGINPRPCAAGALDGCGYRNGPEVRDHLSREAGICRGQPGRAGERLNRIQSADGALIGMRTQRAVLGVTAWLSRSLRSNELSRKLPSAHAFRLVERLVRNPLSVACRCSLPDLCQFLPSGQPRRGCRVSAFFGRHRPFAFHRPASQGVLFLCPVLPRRAWPSKPLASARCLCSSAPFGAPSTRL
jgi:hypothetical protein